MPANAESNAELVEQALELNKSCCSLREISVKLFAEGYKTSKGKPFSPSAVSSMLSLRAFRI